MPPANEVESRAIRSSRSRGLDHLHVHVRMLVLVRGDHVLEALDLVGSPKTMKLTSPEASPASLLSPRSRLRLRAAARRAGAAELLVSLSPPRSSTDMAGNTVSRCDRGPSSKNVSAPVSRHAPEFLQEVPLHVEEGEDDRQRRRDAARKQAAGSSSGRATRARAGRAAPCTCPGRRDRSSGSRKLLHVKTNASTAIATVTGRTSGIATRRQMASGPSPSSRAASKSSAGRRLKLQ